MHIWAYLFGLNYTSTPKVEAPTSVEAKAKGSTESTLWEAKATATTQNPLEATDTNSSKVKEATDTNSLKRKLETTC